MMRGFAAFYGKHRIIAARSGATSYLRSKCIISPQGDASFEDIQGSALIYLPKCDIINSPINKNLWVGAMVRKATNYDIRVLAEMAIQMWDSHTVEELETEFAETLNDKHSAFFIKYINNMPIGFAQCGLRTDYVEGTENSPVGYLEGIFIEEDYRKNGYARELLLACEMWAKDMGCSEFASDCELDNIGSLKFHMAMGFDEANRIICFKKRI